MDPGRLRNLTFLMSLGGLSAGCFKDQGLAATGATTAGTTTAGADATTEPVTTTGSPDTTTTTGTTTGGEPVTSTTTTGEPVTSTTDITTTTDVDTTDDGTTGAEPDEQVCVQYGAKWVECYPAYARYLAEAVAGCAETLAMGNSLDGPMCGEALEEWFACITKLDCALIPQELENPMFCVGPAAIAENLCPHVNL